MKEISQVTARCAREVGSATDTLNKRVLSAEHEKSFLEKKRKEEAVHAARTLLDKKEHDAESAIAKVTAEWDDRIELRVAAEEKTKLALQEEQAKTDKLRKRKVDTEAQATREVQTAVLKAASKRQKATDKPAPHSSCGTGLTAAYAAAAWSAWLNMQGKRNVAAAQAYIVEEMAAAAPATGLAAAAAML